MEFPDNYEKIIELKGIGPYTAAAISSICFNFSVPVLDGNVYRLITRLFGIELKINNITGKRKVERALESVFINNKPGDFNQAIMEFGALYCKPVSPECSQCIFKNQCDHTM